MKQNEDPVLQIIEEVAGKHGIALDRDDPILVVFTINQRLMEASARCQIAMLDTYREDMENVAHEWEIRAVRQANDALEKILGATEIRIASTIRAETESVCKKLDVYYQKQRRDANLTLFASALTLIAAAIVLWAALTR